MSGGLSRDEIALLRKTPFWAKDWPEEFTHLKWFATNQPWTRINLAADNGDAQIALSDAGSKLLATIDAANPNQSHEEK